MLYLTKYISARTVGTFVLNNLGKSLYETLMVSPSSNEDQQGKKAILFSLSFHFLDLYFSQLSLNGTFLRVF